MNTFCLQNPRNETIVQSFYHDAFIHTEDKKVFDVHKVILAMYSPFFHNYFQSRPGHDVRDIHFQNANSSLVKAALDLIYKGKVSIETKQIKKFRWFVETLLDIKLEENYEQEIPSKPDDRAQESEVIETHFEAPGPTINNDRENPIIAPEQYKNSSESTSSVHDNWTLTPINYDHLTKICHSVKHTPANVRQYKCDDHVCNQVSKTFNDASKHFIEKHQKCESERKFLEAAVMARRNCLPKISNIKNDIESGCNVAMAVNQLQLISSELTKHLNTLDSFDKGKFLPPSIYRKSREMCLALDETIKSVEIIKKDAESKNAK